MSNPQQHPSPHSAVAKTIVITMSVLGGIVLLLGGTSAALGSILAGNWPGGWWNQARYVVEQLEGDYFEDVEDFEDVDDGDDDVVSGAPEARGNGGSASGSAGQRVVELSLPVAGLTGIDVDVAAADLTVTFDDVDEATVRISGTDADQWRLRTRGNELVLKDPALRSDFARGCLFGCGTNAGDTRTVALTLPTSMTTGGALNADIAVESGSLVTKGDFRTLDLSVDTGGIDVSGTAQNLSLDVGSGSAKVRLADVSNAEMSVDAGSAVVQLTGAAPASVDVSVDGGSLTVQLPKEEYQVNVEDELGSVVNKLAMSNSSNFVVEAELDAGELILR